MEPSKFSTRPWLGHLKIPCSSADPELWILSEVRKAALNVIVAVIRALNSPEDPTHRTTTQMGLYTPESDTSKAC